MSTELKPAAPAGAALLREYLTKHGLTVEQFSKNADSKVLERTKLVRVLKGARTRIGVDFARAVHEHTNGEVPWDSWCAVPPADPTERRPRTRRTTAPAATDRIAS